MPQVTIVQRVLPHYRIPFFVGLHDCLAAAGIRLRLIYGQEFPGTVPQTCCLPEPWAQQIINKYLRFPGVELVWQPCLDSISGSDLVVVEQANRYLVNYLLHLKRRRRLLKLAYFGHGRNMQSARPECFRERFKKLFLDKIDWWFAYTELTRTLVAASGFPAERITVVQNTIEISEGNGQTGAVRQLDLSTLRAELGLVGDNVAVYCGGMHADKRLDFLLNSCLELRKLLPDFEMLFIGSGPEQRKVEQAARSYSWIHYAGPRFEDRVPYLKLGKALLMPGLVGLVIVDSFSVEVPLITTSIPVHSPEIAYLENGINGIMTTNNLESYVSSVYSYLRSPEQQRHLREGCRRSARLYSTENMIANFAEGIKRCLDSEFKGKNTIV